MWFRSGSVRWSDQHPLLARLLGVTAGAVAGGLVTWALLQHAAPSREDDPPGVDAVVVAPPVPVIDADLVANARHCEKVAETLGDVGRVVSAADSLNDEAVLAELDNAEARMSRRADVPSPRLAQTFDEVRVSLSELRRAIQARTGVRSALDETLVLIRQVQQQCHDVMLAAEVPAPRG